MFSGCTIIAANYLALARVLVASFNRVHPNAPFWVLVVDDPEGVWVRDDEEPFGILRLADIGIEGRVANELTAIYDVLELSTAVKPWLLQHLAARSPEPVLYLDPDIQVFDSLDELAELAAVHGLVVTPHLLKPLPLDGLHPDDAHMLRSGVHNLGFLGVGRRALSDGFFEYWQSRLWRHAIVDVANQMFTDQRWLDWIDCFDHAVLRDPGYNVAYWNVWARPITRQGDRYFAGGRPLRFFHFSGFDPLTPWILSRHQGSRPRVQLGDHPELFELCQAYAVALDAAGHGECRRRPYGWSRSGRLGLSTSVRRLYRSELMAAGAEGHGRPPGPFDGDPDRLMAWLLEAAQPDAVTPRLLRAEHTRRQDLQAAFPYPDRSSHDAFIAWAISDEAYRSATPPAFLSALRRQVIHRGPPLPGINVAGYLSAELGVGSVGRLVVQAADAAGVPIATLDHRPANLRTNHSPYPIGDTDCRYDINVLCANADGVAELLRALGPAAEGPNVGLWHWEAERLAPAMRPSWELIDEVWATSRFTLEALAIDATKPLRCFPLPVAVPSWRSSLRRGDLGLPSGFLVLFCFDWRSVVERKNPSGLIEAFCRAFRPAEGAHLFIKTINGHAFPEQLDRLKIAAGARPDVQVVDGYLDWREVKALFELCDCYASLHRSEGFGLTMAEAMAMAKPVIATGWSGNLDFMDDRVARLVPVQLTPIPDDVPVYGGIGRWASPDLDAAAWALRWVFEHPVEATDLGRQARDHIRTTRSFVVAGEFLATHTERLRASVGSSAGAA